ncbi:hypothetical protein GQX74_011734 [Glossina fuscipes]|nr:hypothetical protein GQX74_011734 [Glossina fuscipes]
MFKTLTMWVFPDANLNSMFNVIHALVDMYSYVIAINPYRPSWRLLNGWLLLSQFQTIVLKLSTLLLLRKLAYKHEKKLNLAIHIIPSPFLQACLKVHSNFGIDLNNA